MIGPDGRPPEYHQAPRTVEVQTVGRSGKEVRTDDQGGVFVPIPGQPVRVVYSVGHPDAKSKAPMFTCPVSAIPSGVFELLGLWNECRLMKVLPRAGGLLDQPQIVRRSFAVFASEWGTVEAGNASQGTATAAALAAGSVLKAAFGGK